MSTEELEQAALKLTPRDRARLAERLLDSLETLSAEENAQLWAQEAARRDGEWSDDTARPAAEVFADARRRLK